MSCCVCQRRKQIQKATMKIHHGRAYEGLWRTQSQGYSLFLLLLFFAQQVPTPQTARSLYTCGHIREGSLQALTFFFFSPFLSIPNWPIRDKAWRVQQYWGKKHSKPLGFRRSTVLFEEKLAVQRSILSHFCQQKKAPISAHH